MPRATGPMRRATTPGPDRRHSSANSVRRNSPPASDIPEKPPSTKRVRYRITSQADIARQLRKIFIAISNGELTADEGLKRARVLRNLADTITTSNLEKRLEAIENALTVRRS